MTPNSRPPVWTFTKLEVFTLEVSVSEIVSLFHITFLLIRTALRFSSGIIRLSSTMEPSGNEFLRKKPVRSTPFLRDFCLFQNLPQNGDGCSLGLVFGYVWGTQKIKVNKLHCDGTSADV